MIWIDSREPSTLRTRVLVACAGDGQIACLEAGDYVLFDPDGCSVGIERKAISDLLGSIASRRLNVQLARMCEYYTHRVLLIEGSLKMDDAGKVRTARRKTQWTHASVQAYLWTLDPSVRIVWTGGLAETADFLRMLYQRSLIKCLVTGEPAPRAVRTA